MYALLVVAPWMISLSVRVAEMGAAGQGGDTQIGSSTDLKHNTINKSASGLAITWLSPSSRRMSNVP